MKMGDVTELHPARTIAEMYCADCMSFTFQIKTIDLEPMAYCYNCNEYYAIQEFVDAVSEEGE
jgi:hypothetical protein